MKKLDRTKPALTGSDKGLGGTRFFRRRRRRRRRRRFFFGFGGISLCCCCVSRGPSCCRFWGRPGFVSASCGCAPAGEQPPLPQVNFVHSGVRYEPTHTHEIRRRNSNNKVEFPCPFFLLPTTTPEEGGGVSITVAICRLFSNE